MSAPGRRLLVVLYHFPPLASVGSARWLAQGKYLRRLGHEVTFLTTSAFGTTPEDDALGAVRTRDLVASAPLRRALGRPALPADGGAAAEERPPPGVLTRLLVPDATVVSWVPWAAAAARRLVRERGIDCVLTTSPHESTHAVGLALPRETPWIADFRDGWTFEPLRPPFYTGLQARLDRRLERAVATRADRVLAATRPIADDLRERLGVDAVHVPNAWDPELVAEADAAEPPALAPDRVSLVHTGALAGEWGRDPGPLLAALRSLADREPEAAARLELVLAGSHGREERELLARYRLDGLARHVGPLSRPAALALQRRAGALLLVTSRNTSEATGKLPEYLAAGRPILALAAGNEAARVVEETGTGIAVPPDDAEGLVAALRDLAAGRLAERYAPRGLAAYVHPAPAHAVAAEVERAIAARAARR